MAAGSSRGDPLALGPPPSPAEGCWEDRELRAQVLCGCGRREGRREAGPGVGGRGGLRQAGLQARGVVGGCWKLRVEKLAVTLRVVNALGSSVFVSSVRTNACWTVMSKLPND